MSAFALMCIVLSLILSRVCVHLKTARSRLHSVMTPRPALPPLLKAPALLLHIGLFPAACYGRYNTT